MKYFGGLLASFLLAATSAQSCIKARHFLDPFGRATIEAAWVSDTVVLGYVRDYTNYPKLPGVLHTPDEKTLPGAGAYSKFTIEIETILKGHADDIVVATWGNHVFTRPDTWDDTGLTMFGLIDMNDASRDPWENDPPLLLQHEANTPVIAQYPCTPALIYKSGSRQVAIAKTFVWMTHDLPRLFGSGLLLLLTWQVLKESHRPRKPVTLSWLQNPPTVGKIR